VPIDLFPSISRLSSFDGRHLPACNQPSEQVLVIEAHAKTSGFFSRIKESGDLIETDFTIPSPIADLGPRGSEDPSRASSEDHP
jgi:hypothetical protein